jgi:hypothetical protein
VDEAAHLDGQRAAAEYLRQLLLRPGRYRNTWEQQLERPREGSVINQLAVAEVIAGHTQAGRPLATTADVAAHRYRQMVADVLSGQVVSRSALSLFAAAFGFAEDEVARLSQLLSGSARISVLSGSHGVPAHAEQEVAQALRKRGHQTLSLHEHIWVGSDMRIAKVRLLQVIEAITDGVDRIPFVCDTNVLTVEIGQGCKELAGPLRQIRSDVFATEILLARTLERGETTTLEYWVAYRYAGDLADPAEREQRRAVVRHIENFDMRIEFHEDRLPTKVWWARWDGIEGDIIEAQEISLDPQHAVHRYLRSLSKTVVGFRWEWD